MQRLGSCAARLVRMPRECADTVARVSLRISSKPRPFLRRGMRSRALRCAMAMVLIPLLVLSVFGGTVFLIHDHGDHGHVHAAAIKAGRFSAAETFAAHHCKSESTDPAVSDIERDPLELLCTSEGLVVSIPDQDLAAARGVTAVSILCDFQLATAVVVLCWIPPDIIDEMGSPGGMCSQGPRHLCALSAGQRLLRTSRALLI